MRTISRVLTKRYILEQLNYIPGGSKQFDRNVIAAYQSLRNELLYNIRMSCDIPPVLYTQLQERVDEDSKTHIENYETKLISTTFNKVQDKASIQIPTLDEYIKATKQYLLHGIYQMLYVVDQPNQ